MQPMELNPGSNSGTKPLSQIREFIGGTKSEITKLEKAKDSAN